MVVFKPAPTTPPTTLRIGELLRGVLPDGVLSVISGSDSLRPRLSVHEGVDKVSFTGSTQTGRKVMERAVSSLKRVTLELGGNDPAIVIPDVDVNRVTEDLFWVAFRNAGQICIATKRMYINKDVYEPLKAEIVDYARTVKIGDGAEYGTQIGPIQNSAQYKRVLELIQDARDNGYKFLIDGEVTSVPGYFVPITILDTPPESARIVQEEQFGSGLPLLKFEVSTRSLAAGKVLLWKRNEHARTWRWRRQARSTRLLTNSLQRPNKKAALTRMVKKRRLLDMNRE